MLDSLHSSRPFPQVISGGKTPDEAWANAAKKQHDAKVS